MDGDSSDVLVVGAGLAGLSSALFLAALQVKVLVVDRYPAALRHPRARAVNPRTVEILRSLGMEQELLDHRTYLDPPDAVIIRSDCLAGPELARHPMAVPVSADAEEFSPCSWLAIDQDRLEALLRVRAEALGAEVCFSHRLDSFSEHGEGVHAVVTDLRAGRGRTVHARFLLAADGARSTVRQRLGIASHGPGTLGHTASLVFRADLSGPLSGRHVGIAHLARPTPGTVLLPHDGKDGWVFSVPHEPDGAVTEALTPERCVAMVREAVGVADLPVSLEPQLPDGTTVLSYEIGARVAERFRVGRTFLVGDSAHAMPPTGALGASTGIQDAHNLAWKLAAVLRGEADTRLLDTYDTERRSVAQLTLAEALWQFRERTGRMVPEDATAAAPGFYAAIFGYRYQTPESAETEALPPERLAAQLGTRAPHLVLECHGQKVSTIDLFGHDFVLLAGPDGAAWAQAAAALPGVVVHQLGPDLLDIAGRWEQTYGLDGSGAVLVRPDGFVTWRSPKSPQASPVHELSRALHDALVRAGGSRKVNSCEF